MRLLTRKDCSKTHLFPFIEWQSESNCTMRQIRFIYEDIYDVLLEFSSLAVENCVADFIGICVVYP